MEKLKDYIYKTSNGDYVSQRVKVDKGIYNFKILLNKEIIVEKKEVKAKTGRDLEKIIRKEIKDYEKNIEKPDEVDNLEDIEEGISEVLAEEESKKRDVEKVKEKKDLGNPVRNITDIDDVFTKRKSSIEMKKLFLNLDVEIRRMDNVIFKTTTLDLVYQVNGMNFLRIRPKTKTLDILTAPDYYKNIIKLEDKNKIDDAMVSINKSYEFIKKKVAKK